MIALNKILVAIDLSESKKTVFNTALSLAQATKAELMLLNIVSADKNSYSNPFIYSGYEYNPLSESLVTMYQEEWEKFKQRAEESMRSLVEEATAAGVNAEFTQESGNPGRTICDFAQTWPADLILVGSRGLSGVKEMFLGSVSNYVSHHAPCSVLIVRENTAS